MKQLGKRTLSYLCILVLLAGFLPGVPSNNLLFVSAASADASGNASMDASAKASGDVQATSADVYVTIADKGKIAVGEDEKHTLMAEVPVHVTDADEDGKLTFHDAMLITHEEYCKEGYEAGESTHEYSVNRLWKDDSGNFGYYISGQSAWSPKDEVETGDEITAFIYADSTSWSDAYSYFSQNKLQVKRNDTVSLQLNYSSWTGSGEVADAALGVVTVSGDASVFSPFTDASGNALTTDASGNAEISFDQPGTYVVSAQSDTMTLVPPVCVVTVNPLYDDTFFAAYEKAVTYAATQAQENEEESANVKNVWNILNLSRSGKLTEGLQDKYISNARTYVKENNGEVEAKYCLALTALGADVTDFEGYNLLNAFSDYETVSQNGVTALTYIIMALNATSSSSDDLAEQYAVCLAERALEEGGWSWGTSFDTDSTAMVLQALAPYYKKNKVITEEIDKALAILSEVQQTSGGFKNADFGNYPGQENSCTTAEVWFALSCLGIDINDERFAKKEKTIQDALLSYQLNDGSFAYTLEEGAATNAMATYEAIRALIAYERMACGKASFYDCKAVPVVYPSTVTRPEEPEQPGQEPSDNPGGGSTPQTPEATTQAPATTTQAPDTTTQAPAQNTESTKVTVAKQTIQNLKSLKKKIKITFTRNKKAEGYQIQCSTSKKFTKKTTRTITLKNSKTGKTVSYTIKKCKSKKTYYVRVRSFQKVNGKRVYGKYSKVKKVQVK